MPDRTENALNPIWEIALEGLQAEAASLTQDKPLNIWEQVTAEQEAEPQRIPEVSLRGPAPIVTDFPQEWQPAQPMPEVSLPPIQRAPTAFPPIQMPAPEPERLPPGRVPAELPPEAAPYRPSYDYLADMQGVSQPQGPPIVEPPYEAPPVHGVPWRHMPAEVTAQQAEESPAMAALQNPYVSAVADIPRQAMIGTVRGIHTLHDAIAGGAIAGTPSAVTGPLEVGITGLDRGPSAAEALNYVQQTPDLAALRSLPDMAKREFPKSQDLPRLQEFGEGIGGMAPIIAADVATGGQAAVPLIMAQTLGNRLEGKYKENIARGMSPENAAKDAYKTGLAAAAAAGLTWKLLPKPLKNVTDRFIVEKLGAHEATRFVAGRIAQGVEGYTLGGMSQAAQNVVTGRPITEGVHEAGTNLGLTLALSPRGYTAREVAARTRSLPPGEARQDVSGAVQLPGGERRPGGTVRGPELQKAKERAKETSKRASEDIAISNYNRLLADTRTDPKGTLVTNARRFRENVPKSRQATNDRQQVKNAIAFFKGNLVKAAKAALKEPWARMAAKQYEGYNIYSHELADRYGYKPEQVMVAESAQSPNASPDNSFEATRRIMKMLRDDTDFVFDKEMENWARNKTGKNKKGETVHLYTPKQIDYLVGKKFSELPKGEGYAQAHWMRAYDEIHHPDRLLRVVRPDGTLGATVKTSTGLDQPFAWTSFSPMQNAINALQGNRSPDVILSTPKVANYYMSKLLAFERSNHVVADTHHTSAAWGNSLPSSHPLVKDVFSSDRSMKDGTFSGYYSIVHEATLQAAKELHMNPKELQAMVWSYQRGLKAPDPLGPTVAEAIQNLWKGANEGNITERQAYDGTEHIAREFHGGIVPAPDYFGAKPGSAGAPPPGTSGQPAELPARSWVPGSALRGGGIPGAEGVAGEPSATLSERAAPERYQWMRNKEGGQKYGNKQEILPLNEQIFNQFVRPRLEKGEATTFNDYRNKYPDKTHASLIQVQGKGKWQLNKLGLLKDIRPQRDVVGPWVTRVRDFDSELARAQGETAHSSVGRVDPSVTAEQVINTRRAELGLPPIGEAVKTLAERAARLQPKSEAGSVPEIQHDTTGTSAPVSDVRPEPSLVSIPGRTVRTGKAELAQGDMFARGYCAEFAIAAHEKTGWPIVEFGEKIIEEGDEYTQFIHYGLRDPKTGMILDARGLRPDAEVVENLVGSDMKPVPKDKVAISEVTSKDVEDTANIEPEAVDAANAFINKHGILPRESIGKSRLSERARRLQPKSESGSVGGRGGEERPEDRERGPVKFYHGQGQRGLSADDLKPPVYFTPDKEFARGYEEQNGIFREPNAHTLNLKNPKIVHITEEQARSGAHEMGAVESSYIDEARMRQYQKQGYDGVIAKLPDGTIYEAAVFDPAAIQRHKWTEQQVSAELERQFKYHTQESKTYDQARHKTDYENLVRESGWTKNEISALSDKEFDQFVAKAKSDAVSTVSPGETGSLAERARRLQPGSESPMWHHEEATSFANQHADTFNLAGFNPELVGSVKLAGSSVKDADFVLHPLERGQTLETAIKNFEQNVLPEISNSKSLLDDNPANPLEDANGFFVNIKLKDGRTAEFHFPNNEYSVTGRSLSERARRLQPGSESGAVGASGGEVGDLPEEQKPRAFGIQLQNDKRLLQDIKDNIFNRDYTPIPNKVTAAEAAALVDKRGIPDVMANIQDESNGLQFHIRSTMGQIVIQRLNETAARLKAAGDTQSSRQVQDHAIKMSEWAMEYGTRLGQGVQSFAMWNRLSPEGKLTSIMRMTKKTRDEFTKRNGEDVDKVVEGVNQGAKTEQSKIDKMVARQQDKIARQLSDTPTWAGANPVKKNEILELIRAHLKERQEQFVERMDQYGVGRRMTESIDRMAAENRRRIDAVNNAKEARKRAQMFDDAADKIAQQLSDTPTFRSRGQPDPAKQLIKDHLKEPQPDFVKRLVEFGADEGTAHTIDRLSMDNRERILQVDRVKRAEELRKQYTPKNKVAKKLKQAEWEKLVELADHGLLTDKSFMDTAAERLGLPRVTPEVQQRVLELAGKIRDATEGLPRNDAIAELNRYTKSVMGYKFADIPTGIYYANMLSGYNTHLVNLIDTALNVNAEINNLALANPKSATKIWGGALRGFGEGTSDFWVALSTGRQLANSKWLEVPDIMEAARFGVKGGVPPILPGTVRGRVLHALAETPIAYPLRAAKYVGRLMGATDALMYRTAKEAKASLIADRVGREEGLRGKALDNRVQELLGRSTEQEKQWWDQATGEGFTGALRRQRISELRSQVRGIESNADAENFAGATTYNEPPRGWLGHFSNAVDRTFAPLPFGRAVIIPFTKIVANVTNRKLDYFPVVGHLRAIRGYYGDEGTPAADERSALMARAHIGTAAVAGLAAAQYAGLVQIHGGGPSDTKKRKQLIEEGWRPYTMEVGGKYYSYMYTPPGLLIASLGNVIDMERYQELKKKDKLTRAAYVVSRVPNTVFNQSFLNSFSNLFDALSVTDPERSIFAWKKFVSTTVGSATTPRIVLDVQRIFDPTVYDADTIQGTLLKNTPFASLAGRPVLNAFGEKIAPPSNRFIGVVTKDLAWQTVIKANLLVPLPSKSLDMPDGRGGKREITPAEYYELVQKSGPEIRKWIIANGPALIRESQKGMVYQEKVQDVLSSAAEKLRKQTHYELYNKALHNPAD